MKKLVAAIIVVSIILSAAINISAKEYEVQEQDTLWDIAKSNDTSVQHLVEINHLDSNIIHPGQTINLAEKEPDVEIYIVKNGDTLSEISSKYNVTLKEIKEWNNLTNTFIKVGQELEINTSPQTNTEEKLEGRTISVTATAYTAECAGCSGITFTGIDLNADRHKKVIAVDPNVIPLGSEVYVEGYGRAIAGDIGGAIKGHKIDIHVPTKSEAYNWGVRTVDVTILH